MIAPSVIQFYTDHYICGNTFRSVWSLREYPTATDEQAILRHLGEKDGVTLRIYTRQVTPAEEKKIISNAANIVTIKSDIFEREKLFVSLSCVAAIYQIPLLLISLYGSHTLCLFE